MADEQAQAETPTDEQQMAAFVTEDEAAEQAAEKPEETTAEAAEKPAAETPEEADDEENRKNAKERIRELTFHRREAERRAAELEARLARLEQGAKPQEDKPAVDAEPDPADDAKYPYGELDKNYLRDFAAHTARQEHKRLQAEAEAQQRQRQAIEQQSTVQSKVRALALRGEKKYEDFQETLRDAADAGAQLSPELALLLAESEVGEDVVYHLAKHPDEAKALVAKPPLAMAAAFGKLETRFAKAEEKKPVATKAPPPPSQKVRGANGQFAVGADTDDFAAFERAAMAAQR